MLLSSELSLMSCDFGFLKFKTDTVPYSSLEQVLYHAVKKFIRNIRIFYNQNRQNL